MLDKAKLLEWIRRIDQDLQDSSEINDNKKVSTGLWIRAVRLVEAIESGKFDMSFPMSINYVGEMPKRPRIDFDIEGSKTDARN